MAICGFNWKRQYTWLKLKGFIIEEEEEKRNWVRSWGWICFFCHSGSRHLSGKHFWYVLFLSFQIFTSLAYSFKRCFTFFHFIFLSSSWVILNGLRKILLNPIEVIMMKWFLLFIYLSLYLSECVHNVSMTNCCCFPGMCLCMWIYKEILIKK